MKHAICNEMFEAWNTSQGFDFPRFFDFVASCGYKGVELAPFTIEKNAFWISAQKRIYIRTQAEKAGLSVSGLHWLLAKTEEGYYMTSPDSTVRQKTADYFIELTRLCADLGGKILVCGSPKQRSILSGISLKQATDYAADMFEKVVPFLEKADVTIALEPLSHVETDFLTTASETIELIEKIGAPKHIALHLDCKAMCAESKPIPEIIHDSKNYLAYFHVNDPNLKAPGFGDLKFEPILQALKEIEYDGWLSLETFDYSGIEKMAKESVEYLNACI